MYRFAIILFVLIGAAFPTPTYAQIGVDVYPPEEMLFYSQPGIGYTRPSLVFDNANSTDLFGTAGGVSAAILAYVDPLETVTISANVESYVSGDVACRIRNGAFVNLGITGNGPSTPVSITAGSSGLGLVCRGVGAGPVTLVIVRDASNSAFTLN